MRILLSTYFASPHVGGLWNYITLMKSGLEERGHQVDILTRHPRTYGYYKLNSNKYISQQRIIRILTNVKKKYQRRFPYLDRWVLDMELKRYSFELAALFLGIDQYDVIHTQDIIATRALSRVKHKQIPIVQTIHGDRHKELQLEKTIKKENKLSWNYSCTENYAAFDSSDKTIVPSQWMKDYLIKQFKVLENDIVVIHNGININIFLKKMEDNINIMKPTDKIIIGCVSRLVPLKGHKYLIDALNRLKEKHQNWICWIIGDGKSKNQLQRQVRDLRLDKYVRFFGNRSDVPALLNYIDIFVHPSVQENLPFSVIEAKVAGKVMVVTDVGGVREIIEAKKEGYVIPPGDSKAIYLHLKKLLFDEELRNEIEYNSKKSDNEKWSLELNVEKIEAIYKSLQGEG